MSNETKRDVVLQIAKENRDLRMYDPESIEPKELIEQDYQDWIHEYDAALPDDLPVIPEAVGEVVANYRKIYGFKGGLPNLLSDLLEPWRIGVGETVSSMHEDTRHWCLVNSYLIAQAWVLGVWRIEETGEIVKLEAEK